MVTSLKLKQLFIITALLISYPGLSAISQKVKYKTTFNNCPSRSAGKFAMRLLKTYEKINLFMMLSRILRKTSSRINILLKAIQ